MRFNQIQPGTYGLEVGGTTQPAEQEQLNRQRGKFLTKPQNLSLLPNSVTYFLVLLPPSTILAAPPPCGSPSELSPTGYAVLRPTPIAPSRRTVRESYGMSSSCLQGQVRFGGGGFSSLHSGIEFGRSRSGEGSSGGRKKGVV